MAKWANTTVSDAYLDIIKNNVNLICACSQQPADRTQAVATYRLATVSVTGLDFSIGAGAGGTGRRLSVSAKNNIPIVASGNVTHLALVDNSVLYFVTTTSLQQLISGNLLNIPAWSITVNDPA